MNTREQVVKDLERAGIMVNGLDEYWIECIVSYRKEDRCGSVNWSTLDFIPVISRLLACAGKHELRTLMEQIESAYPLNDRNYPVRAYAPTPNDKMAFDVKHSLFHVQKSAGAIAAACEQYDHGHTLELEAIGQAGVKLFINSLRLLNALGLSAEEIAAAVPRLLKR